MLTPKELDELPSSQSGLRDTVEDLRKNVGDLGKKVEALKESGPVQGIAEIKDRGEAIANVQLAYRHLEDARMRLGKVLQAADGGISILDR